MLVQTWRLAGKKVVAPGQAGQRILVGLALERLLTVANAIDKLAERICDVTDLVPGSALGQEHRVVARGRASRRRDVRVGQSVCMEDGASGRRQPPFRFAAVELES